MKRIIPVFIGGILGVAATIGLLYIVLDLITPFPDPATTPVSTLPQVVATVNGEAITRDMVEAEIKISRLNVVESMPLLTGDDLTLATAEAVNQLITRHLILQTAASQNFTLDDAYVEQRVNLLFGTYGDDTLDKALAQTGATRDDLNWWARVYGH